MIIYCEECGAGNNVSEDQLAAQDGLIKCQYCKDFLVLNHQPKKPLADQAETPLALSRLVLKYRDLVIEHKGPKHLITMGRQEGSDLRIMDGRVSRLHATISYLKGKYILTDQSLNGTYVLIQNRQGITLKNGDVMLVNQGLIGLGCKVDSRSPEAIRYNIAGTGTVPKLMP